MMPPMTSALYLNWLGVLGLLGNISVKLDDEDRELIERALDNAIACGAPIKWRTILHHIEVEVLSLEEVNEQYIAAKKGESP